MSTFRPLPDGRTYAVTGMKRDAITGRFITTRPYARRPKGLGLTTGAEIMAALLLRGIA